MSFLRRQKDTDPKHINKNIYETQFGVILINKDFVIIMLIKENISSFDKFIPSAVSLER